MVEKTVGLKVGDRIQLKKKHPCGADIFAVLRLGADIRLECTGCGRQILLDRPVLNQRMKKVLE